MYRVMWFTGVLCVMMALGRQWLISPSPCTHPHDHVTAVDACEDDHSNESDSMIVDDRLLKDALLRKGRALIDAGRTVDSRILQKQLDMDQCHVELRREALPVENPPELFMEAKRSVVIVGGLYLCDNCNRWHVTTAAGFVISSSGAVVTCHHVVNSDRKRHLVVMTADQYVYPVTRVLAASHADDLAILQIDAEGLTPLPLADGVAAAPVGEAVSVISHPDGKYYCYTEGTVSRYMKVESEGETVDAMYITADYARGSSGAPVLNRRGQVVGIVSSTESVYYSEEGKRQYNLQMVFHSCTPSDRLLKLID